MPEGFEPDSCWYCNNFNSKLTFFRLICNHWPKKCKIKYQSLDGDLKIVEYASPKLKEENE
jgi:hypothetical protein